MNLSLSSSTHLHFNSHVGQQKPESIVNRTTHCPFCDRATLEGVLAEEGSILLVKNKYAVLQDTLQTVLIETDDCNAELSTYSVEHLHQVIRFGVKHWLDMEESGDYKSVIFYKNHGPLSGGTIHHPHMQIVGLKQVDYRSHVEDKHFAGIPIQESCGVSFNVSTEPRVGFFEFNVILDEMQHINLLADYVQTAAHYVLNGFHRNCNSYNLFFYRLGPGIRVKIVPRFVTSPLFVGFSIPQVSDRIVDVAQEIRTRYF
jgi:ATP adenylyltransferase/5',5'''-P-1,P-4-tetraphosphate phosphorylase II